MWTELDKLEAESAAARAAKAAKVAAEQKPVAVGPEAALKISATSGAAAAAMPAAARVAA